jgi:hypothetical protein
MARLGELLVAAGVLTAEQIDQALRAQVMWGARLGTNLIELGFLDLDALSSALGQQHNLPAALARHFEKVDRDLQQLLSPDVAHKLATVPLLRVGPMRQVVIASTSPLSPKALAIVADEMDIDPGLLIPSVAAELRIRYQLEKIYNIGRPSRFMRSPGASRQSFHEISVADFTAEAASEADLQLEVTMERAPTSRYAPAPPDPLDDLSIDIDLGYSGADELEELDDDDLLEPTIERGPQAAAEMLANLDDLPPSEPVDDLAVPDEITQETSSGKERRRYVRTIADGPEERPAVPIEMVPPASTGSGPTSASLGRIAIRKLATAAAKEKAAKAAKADKDVNSGNTLGEATRAIRRATDRDRVAGLVIDAVFRFMPSCHSASMLVLRGGIATSWKGFCRSGAPEAEVSVPLDEPGLIARVSHRNLSARSPMSDLGPLDQRLIASLGAKGELVAVPVSIAGQVMCVIAMVTEPDAQTGTAESIAAAAGAAFARLMRDASR